ncbi:isoleucine--tRNA ligase [Candidatus Micrarchaeota archaeon]|nr:isoleucine--tRNA ligase [Candidatus Micrarchaeota archaeon]
MYNHKDIEKEIAQFWKDEKIYEEVKAKYKNSKETYYFCDGPPYATGQIHPGTGWNKTIKDTLVRYHRSRGKNVRFQPGFDTHGLPIEVKVEQELKFNNKGDIEKYGIEKFIQKCKTFATKYIGIMSGQFESLGVWADFDAPYITYYDPYIDSSWKTISQAHEKGLLYEGVYVLPYCYRCETTIANYELEYGEETDPSVYVKFQIKDKENEYLVIWTTTPWTLVANMGVMVHPTLEYVRVKVDEDVWVVAKERLEAVMNLAEKSATILEEFKGMKLKDVQYEHPFPDKVKIKKQYSRKVVLSDDYVTIEDGTGLVHMAPGHGPEDFLVGKRNQIEPFCPVNEQGNYTEEAGELAGKNVREANPLVIEILQNNGSLIREARVRHRYPHCWRCKTPLIFLTTKQWFISISKIKDEMMAQIDATQWKPDFAKDRFKEFVTGAPDWCISRQRYWGIPLPIWKCTCGEVKVVGSRKEIPEVKELHRPYIDQITVSCKCGKQMHRIPDVLDVWFDSGNAIWASMSEQEIKTFGEQSNQIIEGQDQIRGWFYSLLGSGVIRYGKCPYKRLLMHGFFVDEKGEKMSKSVGNFIPLEQILEKYGADSFRLWGIGNTIWDELKFSWDEMKKCSGDLNIALNMVVFLERFYPKEWIAKEPKMDQLDLWLLSRLNSTKKTFREAFESTEINVGIKALRYFLVEDLSRFYMKVAKDRIQNGDNAEGALYAIYQSMRETLIMLGCVSPFSAEYLYRRFFMKFEGEKSVFLLKLTDEDASKIHQIGEKQVENAKELVSVAMLARQSANIKVRMPIRTLYVETKSREVSDSVKEYGSILLSMINAKEVKVIESAPEGEFASAPFTNGTVHIGKKIDQELYEEGMMNEVKRRIQILRKDEKLVESDSIVVHLSTEKELEAIIKKYAGKLADAVNAKKIEYGSSDQMTEHSIDGRLVRVSIKKV